MYSLESVGLVFYRANDIFGVHFIVAVWKLVAATEKDRAQPTEGMRVMREKDIAECVHNTNRELAHIQTTQTITIFHFRCTLHALSATANRCDFLSIDPSEPFLFFSFPSTPGQQYAEESSGAF